MSKALTHNGASVKQNSQPKINTPRFTFISEIINELKKVIWLKRNELIYLTVMVLIVSAVVGVFLSGLDYGFTRLIDGLLLGR